MSQANLDLVVLQDTNFIYGVYTHELASYSVVYMGAPIRHCSGVAVFRRVLPRFSVMALQQFGTNVVRFQLMTRERQWYIVGCYLSPDDTLTIDCFLVAVRKRPRCSELLVAGNFNSNLTGPEGAERDKEVLADPAAAGLEDILEKFHTYLCPWYQENGIWIMLGIGREVRSRTDYILETERCLFKNMSVLDSRHNLDHYLIIGCLRSTTVREHEN